MYRTRRRDRSLRQILHDSDGRHLQLTSYRVIAMLTAGLLSACATSNSSQDVLGMGNAPAAVQSSGGRDLTPEEKKVIVAAVAPSLRDAGSAKYQWTKLSTSAAADGSLNYCATVDAKSPFAAYDGRQAYIVEVKTSLGKVTSAVMGLIAGGKDAAIVSRMCAKYGLNPNAG